MPEEENVNISNSSPNDPLSPQTGAAEMPLEGEETVDDFDAVAKYFESYVTPEQLFEIRTKYLEDNPTPMASGNDTAEEVPQQQTDVIVEDESYLRQFDALLERLGEDFPILTERVMLQRECIKGLHDNYPGSMNDKEVFNNARVHIQQTTSLQDPNVPKWKKYLSAVCGVDIIYDNGGLRVNTGITASQKPEDSDESMRLIEALTGDKKVTGEIDNENNLYSFKKMNGLEGTYAYIFLRNLRNWQQLKLQNTTEHTVEPDLAEYVASNVIITLNKE